MTIFRNVRVVATALLLLAPLVIHAQVQASLVAADKSVQPGHPLTVALRLDQQSPWHTYWINAGTGYPTKLQWDLPTGWTAGNIQWPTPILIKNEQGDVTGNGYTDVVYLPVTLTPPATAKSGARVTVKALAKWLMCADVCIPGQANVTLTLPVASQSPEPDAAVRAELEKMPMPQAAPAGWKIAASRTGNQVLLRMSGGALKSPHFFSEDAFIQYDTAQTIAGGSNSLAITLMVSDDADASTQSVRGVLAYTDAAGAYHGLLVNTPLVSAGAAAAAVQASDSASAAATAPESAGGTPVATAASGTTSLGFTLLLAIAGGLILNLMPCVFPVLGIKIVGFVNQSGNDRRKVTMHGLAFTVGVLLSFWVLAGLLATLRAGGEQLGWGFQLQSPIFVFALTAVMLVFALSLSGVFEFGLSATGVGSTLQMRQGYGGSLFAGVLATVVATPCSAPFLAPALGAALALPTPQSFLVFTAIGIGLSAPYLLLSIFPQAVKALPRSGPWMETFKQVMAFPLYATVAYLIWVLAGQVGENGLLGALFGLTAIAMAVWLYGRYTRPGTGVLPARLGRVGGLALLLIGLTLGWPRAAAPTDIVWEPWSAERVAQLREAGRPIYTDFTARWCATCQANKKVVFSSSELKRYFRDHKVATLKADWTNADPLITAELAKWHRSAVPFDLVYPAGTLEPKVLPEILTPGIVLKAFGAS
jgi:thiol:disulfide interchange protein/DsbC/DsbD-like thiol-disulfide interchange protein